MTTMVCIEYWHRGKPALIRSENLFHRHFQRVIAEVWNENATEFSFLAKLESLATNPRGVHGRRVAGQRGTSAC